MPKGKGKAKAGKGKKMFERIRKEIEAGTGRSAWDKGVTAYALELVEELEMSVNDGYHTIEELKDRKALTAALLNGAKDWNQYSWGGSSLCYDYDIALRLCNPSELKKTRSGERRPNAREEWPDTQARALYQAARRIERAFANC